MTATATITISGQVTGQPSGGRTIGPLNLTSAAPVGEVLDVSLAQGDNAIPVPPGATAVLMVPPQGNLVALKFKGAGGDVGVAVAPGLPALLPLTPGTTLIVNAASAVYTPTEFSFI